MISRLIEKYRHYENLLSIEINEDQRPEAIREIDEQMSQVDQAIRDAHIQSKDDFHNLLEFHLRRLGAANPEVEESIDYIAIKELIDGYLMKRENHNSN